MSTNLVGIFFSLANSLTSVFPPVDPVSVGVVALQDDVLAALDDHEALGHGAEGRKRATVRGAGRGDSRFPASSASKGGRTGQRGSGVRLVARNDREDHVLGGQHGGRGCQRTYLEANEKFRK